MRVLGIFGALLGNQSYATALGSALTTLGVDATIVTLEPADFRRYPPPRWARVSEPFAGQAVLAAKLRHHWHTPYDALLVNGWELLPVVAPIARLTPTAVAMDVSPRAAARSFRQTTNRWTRLKSHASEQVHATRFARDAKHVDVFLPWTPWCANHLERDHGIPLTNQVVTLLPVDTALWHPAERREHERPVILWVGNDWQRKGGPQLLSIYREHLAEHADLWLVGHDPVMVTLPPMAGVTVSPGLPRERLPQLYREADIFALPTQREYAGFVFAEAAASGIPVVATDTGGVSALVHDERTGYLLPTGADHSLWTDRLLRLVKDATLRQHMGAAGRRFAEDSLSLEAFTAHIGEVLARLSYTSRNSTAATAAAVASSRSAISDNCSFVAAGNPGSPRASSTSF